MGKKKKKKDLIGIDFSDKSVVATITNSLNKHGEIRGNNKKETRALLNACPHHKINKHGKIKAMYSYDSESGTCTCKMCHQSWPATVDDIETIKKKVKSLQTHVNQAKLFNVAVNGGEYSQKYLAETSNHLANFPKLYDRLSKAVSKQDKLKKKKKKDRRNVGSSEFGSWR